MVRVTYLGVTRPAETFEGYRALRQEWAKLKKACKPLGDDWKAIDAMVRALDAAAQHFTGDDNFYGGRLEPHSSWGGKLPGYQDKG